MNFKSTTLNAITLSLLSLLTVTSQAQAQVQTLKPTRPLVMPKLKAPKFESSKVAPLRVRLDSAKLNGKSVTKQNFTDAKVGGTSGGGGSDIVAEFVVRARDLVNRLRVSHPEIKEIDVVAALLRSTKLKVLPVEVLKDIMTGDDIPQQDGLLAYGNPGFIQLKTKIWDQAFTAGRNMDHHIFHELCRAAAPACNDEAYRISIMELQLAPSSYAPARNSALAATQTNDELLKSAIELSDVTGLRQAMTLGMKLNEPFWLNGKKTSYTSTDAMTPLAYAAMIGNERSIELLIGLGANPNTVDQFGLTAMHYAAVFNRVGTIRYLASRGALVDPSPNYFHDDKFVVGYANRRTPLIATITAGSLEAARTLISLGAKLSYANATTTDVYHPVVEAAQAKRADFITLFVKSGANINEEGWGCWNALACAANAGDQEIVRLVVKLGANPNHVIHRKQQGTDSPGSFETALMAAKDTSMAKLLVTLGANPKLNFPSGNALIEAVAGNDLEMTRYFVSVGASLNFVPDSRVVSSFSGKTALDLALERDYSEIVTYLKSVGAKRAKK